MSAISVAKDMVRLAGGAVTFGMTDKTPPAAYQSMISLFTQTGGKSNDMLNSLVALLRPAAKAAPASGVLGNLDAAAVEQTASELRERGYKLFPGQLDAATVDRLVAFAVSEPCNPRAKDAETSAAKGPAVYPRSAPAAVVYDFGPESLINNPDIQNLMADPSLVAVAQSYIGAAPVLDEVNMWWTTSGSPKADSAAAQLFHFDMDRIRWLKVFIYLTDVTDENGPHSFVAGSHRTGGIPNSLLQKGYARLTDEEVRNAFGADAIKSFTGPKGTILLEDTRGLHKGSPARSGDRLMLEMEFSTSMFGATPIMAGKIRNYHSDGVRQWITARPRMYQRWTA